jgi:uncharacterized membrane protein YhiD involved in acid resistance
MDLTTQATLIGRVALGTFLGYVIGFEREFRGKAAGERTFGLLALGAAAVTGLGVLFFPASAEKVIAGVVTGVGFLGAGLIFRERDTTGRGSSASRPPRRRGPRRRWASSRVRACTCRPSHRA